MRVKEIKRLALLITAVLFAGSNLGAGAIASAQPNGITSSVCQGASAAAGSSVCYPSNSSTSSNGTTPSYNSTYMDSSNQTSSNGGTLYNNSGIYAAMGDSVAAGLGLSALPNATSEDTQCGRSSQSYPYLVAQQTGMQLVNTACSGATAGDLYTNQGVSGPNLGPQLDQAFSQGTPELITITAGANDVHWDSFARACYATDCATDFNAGLARFYLTGLQAKLTYVFSNIQSRSNGNPPTVIVTGYYNPVSNYCKNRQNYVTNAEIDFLNTQRDNLNKTIRDAASGFSFVKYVSADFSNHGLCSNDPWTQGISDTAPLHPTAAGQQQLAQSVMQQVNNQQ